MPDTLPPDFEDDADDDAEDDAIAEELENMTPEEVAEIESHPNLEVRSMAKKFADEEIALYEQALLKAMAERGNE
jgi:hypothetical protein